MGAAEYAIIMAAPPGFCARFASIIRRARRNSFAAPQTIQQLIMSKQIQFAGRVIGDILEDIHAAPHSQEIGAEFERLFRYAAPRIRELDVKNIWRWAEWPGREQRTGLDRKDYGVDAVAELNDGSLVAVQCKCLAEDHKVSRADVQDFIIGAPPGKFDLRWIVAVNEHVRHAEKLIDENDIRTIDFREYLDVELTDKKQPPRQPWELQQEAIDDVLSGFAVSGRDRGKLIMACGTGKTFTALRIAEQLAPHENAAILFIAPSIALVAQARREWLRHTARPLACTVICSDSTAGRNRDEDILHTEISCSVTTKPNEIAAQLARPAPGAARVVFCTYQSLNKLRDAQHKHNAPVFDLALVDEAHRTTGYLDGDRAGLFQLIHKKDEIRAAKRLYMTATPRVYDIKESKKTGNEARIVDMNDHEIYGLEFHRLLFMKAVEAGMLCDFKIIALGIHEDAMGADLKDMLLKLNDDIGGVGKAADEQAFLALGAIALAVNGIVRGDNQPGVLARTIAYASNIRRSRWLARALDADQVKSWVRGSGNALPIYTEHLDGTSSALKRNEELRALNRGASVGAPRLISNARLFTEGVDVPALNAVAFLDPRQSKVDSIQAVGRVMRIDKRKEYGYIVVPVILPPGSDFLQTLENDKSRFKSLGTVLRALQSHDERLLDQLSERMNLTLCDHKRKPDDMPPQEDYKPQWQASLLDDDTKQAVYAQIAKNAGIANRGKVIADAITIAIENAAKLLRQEAATQVIADTIGTPSDNEEESCKTAALLIANACIMHKRLDETGNLSGVDKIERANTDNPAKILHQAWRAILRRDYAPIFHDATALLERLMERLPANKSIAKAIHTLIQCAISNATTLNEIGFDHAGPLYHKVLGSAQSDGAFYTKNLSAYLLAGLAFDRGFADWSDATCVAALRIADPACGTGTLLMAALNIIKKRAAEAQKLDDDGKQKLHKQLVENVMYGFDINGYSVQLAACNLTIGAPKTDYARMNLTALQHGPVQDKDGGRLDEVRHGALELLLEDNLLGVRQPPPPLYGENPVRETQELRMPENFDVVIYNPPFTDTSLQGGRFNKETKKAMRERLLYVKGRVEKSDPESARAITKGSVGSYFTPLTKRLLTADGTLATVAPATFCISENARAQRQYIAANFHVEMVVTSHDPKVVSFSENTSIHECLVIARRGGKRDAPTRFIQLARYPRNVTEADALLAAIESGDAGELYAETFWDAAKVRAGDWTPVQWFNPALAKLAGEIANYDKLIGAENYSFEPHDRRVRDAFIHERNDNGNIFCTIAEDVMQTIVAVPETEATPKPRKEKYAAHLWRKADHVLVASRFRTTSTRLLAVYSETAALGSAFRPVGVQDKQTAKAFAAFLNSSFGAVQLLNRRTKILTYPQFETGHMKSLSLPDPARADFAPLLKAFNAVKNKHLKRLAECTTDPARKILDHAAARAIGIDPAQTDQWREWLAAEPTITNKPAAKSAT